MSNFEWQTEEEASWQPLPPEPSKPPSRHSIRLLSTLFFLILAAAFFLYRQAILQIDAATAANTADLLTTAELLVQAEAEQDNDLFSLLISGSDMEWVITQRRLLDEKLLFDRVSWGLTAVSPPTFTLDTLSPDLRQAVLLGSQKFDYTKTNGDQLQITVTRPLLLRRGENRWLLSPNAPDDFWGDVETTNGRLLTLLYPARDAELMPSLLTQLEAQLIRACTELADVACPTADAQPLILRFEHDPTALLDSGTLHDPRFARALPTPSLLGLPTNGEPADLLAELYAPHVVATALYSWPSHEACCEHALFHQALIDKQLEQLGLRHWPLTPADYAQLLIEPLYSSSSLNELWRLPSQPFGSDVAVTQVYALVDFLLQSERDSLAAMQQRLNSSRDFYDWAQRYIPSSRFSNADYRIWLRFVIDQVAKTVVPPSLPEQTVALLCSPPDNDPTQLLQYDLVTQTWTTLLEDRRLSFLAPLAQDEGLLLLRRQAGRNEAVASLWQNGRLSPALQEPLNGSVFRVEPVGERLLLYRFSFGAETADYSLLDPHRCTDRACTNSLLLGATVWPPSQSQSLSADPNGTIWLADSTGAFRQTLLGRGRAPFWLDDQTAGYATTLEEPALILQTPAGKILAYVPLADLLAQTELPLTGWQVHAAQPIPQTSLLALALNTVNNDNETAVLLLDTATMLVHTVHQPQFGFTPYSPFALSPNGRWLTVQTFNKDGAGWSLDALDWQTEESFTLNSRFPFTFPGYDWSADDQWLLRVGDGLLQLHHPDTGYSETIVHDFSSCYFASWINR